MELLANYQTPEQILSVDFQTLADLLQKASLVRYRQSYSNYAKNSFFLSSSSLSLIIKQYTSLNLLKPPFLTLKLQRFTTLSTANFTLLQVSVKLLPLLSFLKSAEKV